MPTSKAGKTKQPAKLKKKTSDGENTVDFEKALEQLNTLAETMERGNLPLEQSLKHFEKGVGLIRQCQKALADAEQRVQLLTEGSDTLTTFNADEST